MLFRGSLALKRSFLCAERGLLSRSSLVPVPRFTPQRTARRGAMTSSVDWKPIKTHNNPNEGDGRKKTSFGRLIALGLMFAMPVIAFYLGTWQLRRLGWKTKLIAECETKLTYPPVNLPKNFTEDMCEDWEYRKVRVKGHFVYEQEMFVGPRVKYGEKGYLLFTPFIREDTGEKILVERGWIAEEKVDPTTRTLRHLSIPSPQRDIELICLVRPPHERGKFQWEKTDKESRLWQVSDIYDLANVAGCKPIHFQALCDMNDHPERLVSEKAKNPETGNDSKGWALKFWKSKDQSETKPSASEQSLKYDPLDVDMEFSEWQFAKAGVPIGKKPTIDLRNNHLQYLVTWYGLSVLSTIFLVVALRKYWWKGRVVTHAQLKREKLKHTQKYM
ncbi:cytochrome oxidase assembly protein SHY1 KNAG_0B00930 [Huiozyma naganishii CBS 8797]|uniref:SURF1-like protein n=1 Tax=Huiozyma naganishii (strain ATCC MYA-139 / BCRC 22969 / CBS 8797 / KCTC 17520 / NBRC 10181 / NCYC 3082 / Yp74L-3) TaxID=1071383 RepID=J7R173_HUIN7|nr:hypothetical protein KNAG_0B00930 [Kazachstania naganishii CBS 8797]CCK68540.1 hypothetical protein KNAG_0B00930 [Kazachstania naganishii CBS 8797]